MYLASLFPALLPKWVVQVNQYDIFLPSLENPLEGVIVIASAVSIVSETHQ